MEVIDPELESFLLAVDSAPPVKRSKEQWAEFDDRTADVRRQLVEKFGGPVSRSKTQDAAFLFDVSKSADPPDGQSAYTLRFSLFGELVGMWADLDRLNDASRRVVLEEAPGVLEALGFRPVWFDEVDFSYTGEKFRDFCAGSTRDNECTWYWRFFDYL